MKETIFEFDGLIQRYDFGKYYYTAVFLPKKLIPELPFKQYPKLRVRAEIDGVLTEGAFMPDKGQWFIMTPRKLLKVINKKLGEMVNFKFVIADQGAFDMPPDLELELNKDLELKAKWNSLSVGKRRGLAYRISKIKTSEVRERHIMTLLERIQDGDLPTPP